jgi:hypothetical protein
VLRAHRTLAILRAQLSAAFQSNLSQGEAQGGHGEAICHVLAAGVAPDGLLDIAKDHEEDAAAVHHLRRRPKLQLALGKGLRVHRIVLR